MGQKWISGGQFQKSLPVMPEGWETRYEARQKFLDGRYVKDGKWWNADGTETTDPLNTQDNTKKRKGKKLMIASPIQGLGTSGGLL